MNVEEELKIESGVFDNARNKFNSNLQSLIFEMLKSGSEDGQISIKFDISMSDNMPLFKYQVNASMNVKYKDTGLENPEMALHYDNNKGYVLRRIPTSQMSIFDMEEEQEE